MCILELLPGHPTCLLLSASALIPPQGNLSHNLPSTRTTKLLSPYNRRYHQEFHGDAGAYVTLLQDTRFCVLKS